MISDEHAQVVALFAENIHRRILDREDPIEGDPFTEKEAAQKWLARTAVERALIGELADDPNSPEDAIGALVAFAATAVEIWAAHTDHDPFALIQAVVAMWERSDADG